MNTLRDAASGLLLALVLAWKDCRLQVQSRAALIFIVLMPLALTLLTGLAFWGGPGGAFNSFCQAVAGSGVMFILFNCILGGGMALVRERRQHTLDRLLISPMSRGTIVLGKTLGVFAVGVVQAVVIFGFGVLLGVSLVSLPGLVLVTLLFILVGCALGLLISGLARREETVGTIGVPATLLMTALGGGMFPAEMAHPWMQKVAYLFPTGWAMDAYRQLMRPGGASLLEVWPNLLVLACFAVAFLAVGIRCLRWE